MEWYLKISTTWRLMVLALLICFECKLHSRVVYSIVELNTFLQASSEFDIPLEYIRLVNSSSKMKSTYIALLVSIQLHSEKPENKFVDEFFRRPCHIVIHMVDNWENVGNYNNISCWCTECGYKNLRAIIIPLEITTKPPENVSFISS